MEYSVLARTLVFRGIDEQEIEEILSTIPFQVKNFRSGSLIALSGESVHSLMIVVDGVVKGEMVDYGGRVIKIEDIYAPGVLAPAFIFGKKNAFPVNVVATSDSTILLIQKSDFLKVLMTKEVILTNYLDMISDRAQFLSEKIKFLNFKTIKAKLAQYILHIAGNKHNTIRLDRTQDDLAYYFGVARPSIARTLNEMEEEGFIEANGKNINILNKESLRNLTSD